MNFGERRGWGITDVVLYLVGVAGLAAALTILWLGMRAVLDIGGYCAEGGPYVIDRHCPDGVALLIPLSIFGGLGSAALMGWKGAALGGAWAGLVLLAWPALFLGLGWNFLQYAFAPPPPSQGVELGWLIPGIIFVIMGAVPLLALIPSRSRTSGRRREPAQPSAGERFAADGEARYSNELRRTRKRLLRDLVAHSRQQVATQSRAASETIMPEVETDLVSQLERLSALYRAGSLSYDEFQRAKQALLDGLGG
jgi:hypothetical protein